MVFFISGEIVDVMAELKREEVLVKELVLVWGF